MSEALEDFIIAIHEVNSKFLDDLEQENYEKAQSILQEQTQLIDQAIKNILPQIHILDIRLEKVIAGED